MVSERHFEWTEMVVEVVNHFGQYLIVIQVKHFDNSHGIAIIFNGTYWNGFATSKASGEIW